MKKIILLSLFLLNTFLLKSNNSILRDGNWLKIGITESGVYKIDLEFFKIHNLDDANIDFNDKSQNGKLYLQKGTYSISIKTDNTTIENQFIIK